MQTQDAASQAKWFIGRLDQIEKMEHAGAAPEQVNAHYQKFISELFKFLQSQKFMHEVSQLQEISTRIEPTWGSPDAEAKVDRRQKAEIKALLEALITGLEAQHDSAMESTHLDPFSVIIATAAELPSSDLLLRVIGLSGIKIDLKLPEKDAYSHGTRIRAYLARVQSAYDALTPDKKLRVAWVLATEIQRASPDTGARLNERLNDIGWGMEDERLVPTDARVTELFFPKGAFHDAFVEIRNILNNAQRSLRIADPYMDENIFKVISELPKKPTTIQLMTMQPRNDFVLEAKRFMQQHSWAKIEIKTTSDVHDRFIIVDDTRCFHVGASIKDAGNKAFMISEIEGVSMRSRVMAELNNVWSSATAVSL